MRTFGIIAAVVVGLAALVAVGYGIRWVVAPVEGAVEQREIVQGQGEYRIANYQMFYDLCHDIKAYEAQMEALEDERELESTSDNRKEEIGAALSGLRGQRARAIERYNSSSRQDLTRAMFKADDLPYELSVDEETTCEY